MILGMEAVLEIVGTAGESGRAGGALAQLEQAASRMAAEEIDGTPTRVLGEELVAIRREMDRLEADFVRRLAQFQRQRGPALESCSLLAWLRAHVHMSHRDAEQLVQLAEELPRIDGATDAFRRGDISVRNASILARGVTGISGELPAVVAAPLVTAAIAAEPHRVGVAVADARHRLDAEGARTAAERAFERRYLHIGRTTDAMYYIDGRLDEEGGRLLETALDALSMPAGPGDQRTAVQRRADAAGELGRRHLQRGDLPGCGGQRPHLLITVPVATLRGEPGAPAADLGRGVTVTDETVRRLACDASISEVEVDQVTGAPLHAASAERRTIPPSVRRALVVRDKGCRFPGCDRPVEWCEAHHIEHWVDDGRTVLENLVLLCRMCHRRVHEGRWRIVSGRDGPCFLPP